MIMSTVCILKVDAALGAEEMVQQLADSKLNLEERVKDLEEAVADLEALQDMNEQLQEGSRELEIELREEVDLANFATREVRFLWIRYHVFEVGSLNCHWKCTINYWIAFLSISQHIGTLLFSLVRITFIFFFVFFIYLVFAMYSTFHRRFLKIGLFGNDWYFLEIYYCLTVRELCNYSFQAHREKEAALETLADRELTIAKFRELVQRMQEQNQELQRQLERESTKPVSALPEILDFKV